MLLFAVGTVANTGAVAPNSFCSHGGAVIFCDQIHLIIVNVFEARSVNGSAPKYSVQFLIPKTDTATVKKVKAGIRAAYRDGESKLRGSGRAVPALENIKTPLRDGDRERSDDPVYAGMYFLNANSTTAPGIVDRSCQPIRDRGEVYSGCYGRASVDFYAFAANGNRGISCGLNNLQKMRDGEPLGGRTRPEDDFTGLDDEDDFLD